MGYTIEEIKELFERDGRGYVLRDWDSFTRVRDKHHLRCPIHPDYDWYSSLYPILSKRKSSCPICAKLEVSKKYRSQSEDVRNRLFEHGFVLVGDYLNMHKPVSVKCNTCGTVSEVKVTNIVHGGQGCYECNGTKPLTKEDVTHRLSVYNLVLLDTYSGSIKDKHRVLCEKCGHIREVRLKGVVTKGGCPNCSKYGFSKQKSAWLYYVYGTNEYGNFFKVGITNRSVSSRNKQTFHTFIKLYSGAAKGNVVYFTEQYLLKRFSHLLQKEHKFSGGTECFVEDIRKHVDIGVLLEYAVLHDCDLTEYQG